MEATMATMVSIIDPIMDITETIGVTLITMDHLGALALDGAGLTHTIMEVIMDIHTTMVTPILSTTTTMAPHMFQITAEEGTLIITEVPLVEGQVMQPVEIHPTADQNQLVGSIKTMFA